MNEPDSGPDMRQLPGRVKTEADALLLHQKRLDEQRDREARWLAKRKRFCFKMAIAGGLVFALTCRASAFGGSMAWFMWPLALLVGAGLCYVIARFSLGVLKGAFVYGLGCFFAWLVGFAADGFKMKLEGSLMDYGPLILMVMGWLSWMIAGSIFGLLSSTYEDDHVHI